MTPPPAPSSPSVRPSRRSAARRALSGFVAVGLVVSLARPALAQTWGEIELPGGVTAARNVLGLGNETRTPAAFLVDFVRAFHQFGGGDSLAVEKFARYLGHLQQLRAALALWPEGPSLGTGRLRGQARDRWRGLAELLGLRLREVRDRPVLEVARGEEATERAGWLKALGIDVAAVAAQLNKGERVRLAIPTDALPLPVPKLWPALLQQPGGPPDIVRLGATRVPALLYTGLLGMDEETLAYIAQHPELLDLGDDQAGVFAAFGRSIQVRESRIAPAGGAAFAPLWVEMVDRRLNEPHEFVRRLLSRDEGRLAFLYDTVAHASPTAQSALLDGATRGEDRRDVLDRQYRWFRDVEPAWKVGTRPFYRPTFDPSLALALLDLQPDGLVGPAWWPQVLERITSDDGWPDRPIRDLRDERAGLQWALRWLFDAGDSQGRFLLLRFAQRRFAQAPRSAAPLVEVALRGFNRMPALLLSLERIGVDDPALFAEMAAAAYRLTTAGDARDVDPALRQWQAALSLLEQVHRRRPIRADTRDALLRALAGAVPPEGAWLRGSLGLWLNDHLMQALAPGVSAGAGFEAKAIEAWLDADSQPDEGLTWEGLDYRIDRVGPVVRDAIAIRASAKGPTLGDLDVLVHARRELEKGLTSLDQAKAVAARLQAVAKLLGVPRDEQDKPLYETGDLEDAARTLARMRRPRDLERAGRQVPKVLAATDMVAHHVLPALAYALAAAPTPQPQLYGDTAARHYLTMSGGRLPDDWRARAWALPKAAALASGGSGTEGSLLALDLSLADSQLRRLVVADSGIPPVEGTFNPPDREGFVMRLVLPAPAAGVSPAAKAVLDALQRGRQRVKELATAGRDTGTRTARDTLLDAGVGEMRSNLLLWLWERKLVEAADEILLPTERFHLGTEMPLPAALGVPSVPFDGCLCLRPAARRAIDDWVGRGASGHLSVLVADVQVRLIEALTELRLPVGVMELVLPMAVQDAIDRVGQFAPEDWEALAVARFLPRERVEEYLLALIAEGILAPPKKAANPGGMR